MEGWSEEGVKGRKGRSHEIRSSMVAVGGAAAESSGLLVRSANHTAQRAEKIFTFIFELSGWALVTPSYFED